MEDTMLTVLIVVVCLVILRVTFQVLIDVLAKLRALHEPEPPTLARRAREVPNSTRVELPKSKVCARCGAARASHYIAVYEVDPVQAYWRCMDCERLINTARAVLHDGVPLVLPQRPPRRTGKLHFDGEG